MVEPIMRDAVRLRDKLREIAGWLRSASAVDTNESKRELAEMDAHTCENAAVMLQKLGMEVTRLRLGILNYLHGQVGRPELRGIAESWNNGGSVPGFPDPPLIFVSMPYSSPMKRIVNTRMGIYVRMMSEYALRGENVTGILWFHFALDRVEGLSNNVEFWKPVAHRLIMRSDRVRVLTVYGWKESKGVQDEIKFAQAHGIPVEYDQPS